MYRYFKDIELPMYNCMKYMNDLHRILQINRQSKLVILSNDAFDLNLFFFIFRIFHNYSNPFFGGNSK